jgi:hypothetical protein
LVFVRCKVSSTQIFNCHRITACIFTQIFHAAPPVVRVTACSTLRFHVTPHPRMHIYTDLPRSTACCTCHRMFYTAFPSSPHAYLHRSSTRHRLLSSTPHRLLYVSPHVLHCVYTYHRMLLTQIITACSTLRLHASPHVVDTDHPRGTACYTCHRTLCPTYQRVTVSLNFLYLS